MRHFLFSWILLAVLGMEARAQNSLLPWKELRDLMTPRLSKEQVIIAESQRNAMYVDVRSESQNTTNRLNLAVIYERLGEHVHALELYRDLVPDNEMYEVGITGFTKNLYLSGNTTAAERFITLIEGRHALGWECLLIKAEINKKKVQLAGALRFMEEAWTKYVADKTARDPIVAQIEKEYILNNLAHLYQHAGDKQGVAKVLSLMERIEPER